MATIVTRSGKGSALTHTEMDANFNNLNNSKVETVASISDLINASTSNNYNVLNYHSDVEGGGGVFYWDATKAKSEHNGGTIIDPTAVYPIDWNNQTQLGTWFDTSNAGTGCWVRQFDGAVNVRWFGAKGDGVTDDTKSIQEVITAFSSVHFLEGTYLCGEVDLPERDTYLYADSAIIQGTSTTHIFKQIKRGHLFKCVGLVFTGNAIAFNYDSDEGTLPNGGQFYEYHIESCQFLIAAAVPAIRLYGSREGLISECYFEGNSGIYTEFTINTVVNSCQYKNCSYMVLSKLGSEGLIINNAVALGCSYGVRAERTTGVQINNSMIDYCDSPVYLQGATDVLIQQNYISTRTASPAIRAVKYTDGFRGYNHIIKGNNIRDNHSTTGSACIRYEESDFVNILDNVLGNYASYAIVYNDITQSKISRNIIRNRTALGTNSILALTDDSSVSVFDNTLTQTMNRTYISSTWSNAGFVTENTGEAVATSGNSSVVVTHGVSYTPAKKDIQLTQTAPITGSYTFFVSAVTSTSFTITFTGVLSNTVGIAWRVASRA